MLKSIKVYSLLKNCLFVLLFLIFYLTFIRDLGAYSIEPARIELSIPGGKQKGKTVTINNTRSDEPLHLKIYVQDVIFLPDGTNDFLPPASTEWSCANWIQVVPDEIDVPAGKTQSVRVSVSVPVEAKGGYYAMLFFESRASYFEGLAINFRLGGLVDVTVTNTELRQAKLAGLSFVKPNQIEVGIFNEGNVLLRPKGSVKIFSAQGKKLKQIDFNPERLGILPKTLRKFLLKLDNTLGSGKYRLKSEIDYGTKYILVGELPVDIE